MSISKTSQLSSGAPHSKSSEAPSTLSILLSPSLPNRPPNSALGAFVWRRRMWFEATFVFTLLEPWEKILLLTLIWLMTILVLTGMFQYFPKHLKFVYNRAEYYWYGGDASALVF